MVWFLKIGLCLILSSLVLELLSCLFRPITYTDKTRKLDDIWMGIFATSLSSDVIFSFFNQKILHAVIKAS